MIPPLLMDVKPGMTLLDLCAAPGSKAAQLIEMVHAGEEARMLRTIAKSKRDNGREASPDGEIRKKEIQEEEQSGHWLDDGRTTGLLIANDADYKRSHMLIHQMKRLNSPNLIVTNHDATMFPSIKLPSEPTADGGEPIRGKYLKFDRILADVPCSGDGTCRKNPNVWKDWNPGNAIGLFSTQLRILTRAISMLRVGGKVVYSTCSMNPVENEAVVAAAIERCGGQSRVELVDCSDALPNLERRQGLTSWKVMDKHGRMWSSWQEVEQEKAKNGEDGIGRLSGYMFPPQDSEENVPLDRCMRIYPHLQDTGGFFITVLQKKSEIKVRPEEQKQQEPHSFIVSAAEAVVAQPTNGTNPIEKIEALDDIAPPSPVQEDGVSSAARQNKENVPTSPKTASKRSIDEVADAAASTKRPKFRDEVNDPAPEGAEDRQIHFPPPPAAQLSATRPEANLASPPPLLNGASNLKKNKQPYEEPFIYISPDHAELRTISAFYNLSPRFPLDRFMVRNATGHPAKTIYYTSALARSILTANEGSGIKFVHCGVKMFVKQDVQREDVCRWRIQAEGLPVLEGWVGEERVVRLTSRKTLRALLIEMFPKVDGQGWRELGEIGERVRDAGMGCCVLRVEKGEGEDGFGERMVLPLWRSLHSLNLMLPKEERKAMLLRLYGEDTPLMDHSKDRFKVLKAQGGEGDTADDEGGVVDETIVEAEGIEDLAPVGDKVDEKGGEEHDVVPEGMKEQVGGE